MLTIYVSLLYDEFEVKFVPEALPAVLRASLPSGAGRGKID
jgi:hypothetical protein